jgi:hypothetical protein
LQQEKSLASGLHAAHVRVGVKMSSTPPHEIKAGNETRPQALGTGMTATCKNPNNHAQNLRLQGGSCDTPKASSKL